ncbi:type VI secretion system protein [Variovorax sp. LARHSF232]
MTQAQLNLVWQVALASMLSLALLWWLARGARRWARQRSLRQALARVGGSDTPALEQAFVQARQALQPGAAHVRPQALHARPWVLFLGSRAAAVPELLRAADASSAAPHGDAAASFWRWWLMPGLVAIETDARLPELEDESAPHARQLLANWYQALLVLADRRGALPLDGIALCVDAQSLLTGPQAAGELAARLRRRADEASQHLRLRLPTQVLITGLDRLPGYAAVRAALPEEVLAQAVGFRVPVGTLVVIDDMLNDLSDRLRALRMALLREQVDAPGRLAVHEFFVQWLALQAGLSAFLKRLFAPNAAPAPYRLRGRGLYFVAAPAASTDIQAPAFVADLFSRFLPLERAFRRAR